MAARTDGFGIQVYEALRIAGKSTTFLVELEASLASPTDDAALDRLAVALSQSPQPEALSNLIHAVSPLLGFYKHQRDDPNWKLGTYIARRQLVDRLWKRAMARSVERPEASRTDARAALLLAAQEAFQYAPATVDFLLQQTNFDSLAQWPAEQLAGVRALLAREKTIASTFIDHLTTVSPILQSLLDDASPAMDQAKLDALLAKLDELAPLAIGRPHIQWRIANLAWRTMNLCLAKSDAQARQKVHSSVAQWKAALADPQFDRWLDEAFSTPAPVSKGVGIKFQSADDVKKRLRPAPVEP